METIIAPKAPAALGPYSAAIKVGELIFTSGQIPADPATGELAPGGIAQQTEHSLKILSALLQPAGSGLDQVIKTTCFLTDMADFAAFNAAYGKYFSEHKPARSTVAVKALPKGALVEIECVAEYHKDYTY